MKVTMNRIEALSTAKAVERFATRTATMAELRVVLPE